MSRKTKHRALVEILHSQNQVMTLEQTAPEAVKPSEWLAGLILRLEEIKQNFAEMGQ